jgi:hypothetical protein
VLLCYDQALFVVKIRRYQPYLLSFKNNSKHRLCGTD